LSSSAISTPSETAWNSLLIEVPVLGAATPIQILTAGARTEGYFRKVRKLDVQSFYEDKNGGYIIETLRNGWKSNFDFVLVDSRTGITDIGGICTIQLPDILALVFTATEQSLLGVVDVAGKAAMKAQDDIINRYQSTLADLTDREAGQLAMAKGDSFLFAFQKSEQALSCAIDIQESLAIRKPIVGPLGPLRVRIAIHSSSSETGMQRLLEIANQIANRSVEGQVLVSDETIKRLPAPRTDGVESRGMPTITGAGVGRGASARFSVAL
jgi:hypothetical protein